MGDTAASALEIRGDNLKLRHNATNTLPPLPEDFHSGLDNLSVHSLHMWIAPLLDFQTFPTLDLNDEDEWDAAQS